MLKLSFFKKSRDHFHFRFFINQFKEGSTMMNKATSFCQQRLPYQLLAYQRVGFFLLFLFFEESKAFSFASFDNSFISDSHQNGSRRCRRRSTTCAAMWMASSTADNDDDDKDHHHPILVALTREDGKNDKMVKALQERDGLSNDIQAVEVPCIAHANGPDMEILANQLKENCWDYVIITSPEAARVAASVWSNAVVNKDNPPPAVAAVGKATESTLKAHGINVVFTPSKATAETLAMELPLIIGTSSSGRTQKNKVMYPASCKAQDTLQTGLTSRGFDVLQLNTYDTITAEWTLEQRTIAAKCKVACFASPSSVKGWLKNTHDNTSVLAACIGTTSADACRKLGWKDEHIFYPEYPGIDGWVDAVQEAVNSLSLVHDDA